MLYLFSCFKVCPQILKEAFRTMPTHGTSMGPRVHTNNHSQRGEPKHLVQQTQRPHTEDTTATTMGVGDQGQYHRV